MSFPTPVLLCLFNRPDLTARVFQRIAEQRPATLLLVADGPRPGHPTDADRVHQCREIVQKVPWDCRVLTHFSETNLGCRQRMATGLRWAFDQVEELIVLEDDCLPDPHFFGFCRQMLQKYATNPRIGMICGDQFLSHVPVTTDAYLSKFAFVWGWASWRRAWQHYDLPMTRWPLRNDGRWLALHCGSPSETEYWQDIFERQAAGLIDTWDYSWMFNAWDHGLQTVHPKHNLVSNIGFRDDATHTTDASAGLAAIPTLSQTASPPPIEWSVHEDPLPLWEATLFREVFHASAVAPSAPRKRLNPWQKLQRWLRRSA